MFGVGRKRECLDQPNLKKNDGEKVRGNCRGRDEMFSEM